MMQDSELIELLRRRPEEGVCQAIAQYGGYAKAVAVHVLGRGRQQDIEEILGDVFCAVWQQTDRYNPEKGSFKGWICTITRNLSIDKLRREQPAEPLPDTLDFTPDFTDAVAAKTNRRIVRDTVTALPEPDRTIFYRRYFLRDSIGSIAQMLHMEYKAVENRLYRGKQRLRKELEERGVVL